jgi:nucleoid-associated protein YgaU
MSQQNCCFVKKEFRMTEERGKNIFEQAINAVSNRDEKAAIEAAAKKMAEIEQQLAQTQQKLAAAEKLAADNGQKTVVAERKIVELQDSLTKSQAELTKTKQLLTEAEGRAAQAESRVKVISNELETIRQAQIKSAQASVASAAAAAAAEEEAKKRIIAEHTLTADETLSHLSLKYYGSAYEPYWRVIYEANKELIGPNPARVRPGMVIKIPVKPENLK